MEESRTNEFPYSEDFSTSSWNNVNTTVTTNAAIAPDGTSTANRLQIGDTDGGIYDNTVGAVASNSTISMWVKSVNPDIDDVFRLTCAGDFSGDLIATNEWVRYTFTSSTTTSSLHGIIRPADNTATDIYVWGAQFEEEKTFPTSYIPTAGTTETRAADIASITGANFSSWYNQSEGTAFAEYDGLKDYARVLDLGNGNPFITSRPAINAAYDGVTETASTADLGLTLGDTRKSVTAYSGTTTTLTISGLVPVTGNSDFTSTTNTVAYLGGQGGNSNVLNGHISRLAYFPTRLPDDKLKSITT